jgi:hypothetical protein
VKVGELHGPPCQPAPITPAMHGRGGPVWGAAPTLALCAPRRRRRPPPHPGTGAGADAPNAVAEPHRGLRVLLPVLPARHVVAHPGGVHHCLGQAVVGRQVRVVWRVAQRAVVVVGAPVLRGRWGGGTISEGGEGLGAGSAPKGRGKAPLRAPLGPPLSHGTSSTGCCTSCASTASSHQHGSARCAAARRSWGSRCVGGGDGDGGRGSVGARGGGLVGTRGGRCKDMGPRQEGRGQRRSLRASSARGPLTWPAQRGPCPGRRPLRGWRRVRCWARRPRCPAPPRPLPRPRPRQRPSAA